MTPYERFELTKQMLGFDEADVANLKALGPVFEKHGAGITDTFYATLGRFPETAAKIEGRVDKLKGLHGAWLATLFGGAYGEEYFNRRVLIGQVHVDQGIPPHFVETVMSLIRSLSVQAMAQEISDAEELASKFASLTKALDLDSMAINMAYAADRLARMSKVTGMSSKLIERMMNKPKKKK